MNDTDKRLLRECRELILKYGNHSEECRRDRALYEAGYACKATGSKSKFTCCCGWDELREQLTNG